MGRTPPRSASICRHMESPAQAGRLTTALCSPPCMAGSDPKPLQEPLARGTPPSLTSTQPRGPHPSACLACGKGRIQDIAEQKLAGLLMPQDGDGEPQVVDLLGRGCSEWVAAAQGAQGKGRRSHL